MPEATTPAGEQLMSDYFALRRGDLSKLDVISESFRFVHPLGEVHGPDELVSMQDEQADAFPDVELTVEEMLVEDDVAMWEWTLTGTHEGEWMGQTPTGREVSFSGISKTTIVDGKIEENRAYFDAREVLAQLEATE